MLREDDNTTNTFLHALTNVPLEFLSFSCRVFRVGKKSSPDPNPPPFFPGFSVNFFFFCVPPFVTRGRQTLPLPFSNSSVLTTFFFRAFFRSQFFFFNLAADFPARSFSPRTCPPQGHSSQSMPTLHLLLAVPPHGCLFFPPPNAVIFSRT